MSDDKCRRNDEIRMVRCATAQDFRHLSIRNSFGIRHSCFVILFLASLGLASCGKESPLQSTRIDPNGPVEVVVPEHGAYTGAFMDFGDEEDDVTVEMIEDFE